MKMTISLQQLAKEKSLPVWMTKHPVFKSIDKIEKVFPNIGLPNCSEPCGLIGNFALEEAKKLLAAMVGEIRAPLDFFAANDYIDQISIIEQFDTLFCDRANDFISYAKGEIVLKLPEDIIVNGIVRYNKNTPLFAVYAQLAYDFSRLGGILPMLEKLSGYKDFNMNNVSSDNSSIVFSSDGVDGLWDIATMSMRGISSCVRWAGPHKLTLIGSIADPFTGIIYLTSGKNYGKYGSRMIKRCIVRFVIDSQKEQPYLLIDRMYPSLSDNVLKIFTDFLISKTGLEVYFGPRIPGKILSTSYIPRKSINDKLSEKTLTYRDTKIPIGKIPSKVSERKDLNIKVKQHNLLFKMKQATPYLQCIQAITDNTTANLVRTADFQYLITEYSTSLLNNIANKCPAKHLESSSEHIKRMCYYFLANKNSIIKTENEKFIRVLKKYFGATITAKNMITITALKPMLSFMSDEIKKVVKGEIFTLIRPDQKKLKASKMKLSQV